MIHLDFIFTLLAVVGCWVVVKFLYRGYCGFRKLKYMNELIKRYDEDSTPEASIDRFFHGKPSYMDTIPADIYKWCINHSPERDICARHRATQEDFRKIFVTLIINYSVTIKGFFVPVASFFFYPTLDYILKNKADLNSQRAFNDLRIYFERQ